MSLRQRVEYGLLIGLWLAATWYFWEWWLQGEHVIGWGRFVVNSLILAWTGFLPAYYFYFVFRMKLANPKINLPEGMKVAMVVTKAPSEPWPVVKRTLEAMLQQEYAAHDTWLADEDISQEAKHWCAEQGVFVSCRKGVADYQRSTWPRRAKCKEGNLAYFYDKYGYGRYEVVVQLDADHVPDSGYLEEMLRPFVDPEVGYVSAPSICDLNAKKSWSARARLYAEASLHGSLQAGYHSKWAPMCIGSHYAVRTRALRQIGGLGPELAEDHTTTLMMQANGWRGVHALNAIAHGEGPATFADCMTQEFQWSRSLTIVMLTLTPKLWSKLSWRLRFEFVFAQLWYPMFSLVMLMAYLIPVVALATGTPWVQVEYVNFVWHSIGMTMAGLAVVGWVKANKWLRPIDSPIMSWEMVVFQLTRWPWVLLGVTMGVMGVVMRKQFEFRVTPKGIKVAPLPIRSMIPYGVLLLTQAVAAVGLREVGAARGYYYFTLINSWIYLVILMVIVGRHVYERRYI